MGHGRVSTERKQEIASQPGVVSVGEGIENGERAVIISVTPSSGLGPGDFPTTVEGHPVFVQEEEPPELIQTVPNRERDRPVVAGTSTGNENKNSAGTVGFVMTDGQTTYISSNYHVWASGAEVGDPISQPADLDSDLPASERKVAELTDWIDPNPKGVTVDMCWARVDDGILSSPRVFGLGPVRGTRVPEVGDPVVKSGRTTGITRGEVVEVGVSLGLGGYGLADAVKATEMTDSGDSGSPVMHDDGSQLAAGAVFAGDAGGPTYFCSIDNWEAESGLEVATADSGLLALLRRLILSLLSIFTGGVVDDE